MRIVKAVKFLVQENFFIIYVGRQIDDRLDDSFLENLPRGVKDRSKKLIFQIKPVSSEGKDTFVKQ